MQAYTLFASPAIFIIIGIFWEYLYHNRKRFKYKIIPYIFIIGLIAFPIRYSIERLKPFNIIDRSPEWVKEIKSIHSISGKQLVVFNTKHPIETMFYVDCTAYIGIPDKEKIEELKQKGFEIIILNN